MQLNNRIVFDKCLVAEFVQFQRLKDEVIQIPFQTQRKFKRTRLALGNVIAPAASRILSVDVDNVDHADRSIVNRDDPMQLRVVMFDATKPLPLIFQSQLRIGVHVARNVRTHSPIHDCGQVLLTQQQKFDVHSVPPFIDVIAKSTSNAPACLTIARASNVQSPRRSTPACNHLTARDKR